MFLKLTRGERLVLAVAELAVEKAVAFRYRLIPDDCDIKIVDEGQFEARLYYREVGPPFVINITLESSQIEGARGTAAVRQGAFGKSEDTMVYLGEFPWCKQSKGESIRMVPR